MTAPDSLLNLFERALELDPSSREEFLLRECGSDTTLLSDMHNLLAGDANAEKSEFWRASALEVEAASAGVEQGREGEIIGAYRILELLGSGGMGFVYRAVRADSAFEKSVAVKILKRGMDTAPIVQRFRKERQILARLDHANIARLIDGGCTPDGLPYLVMEHVEGLPIDRFVQEHNLSTNERIALFRHVCSAVNYAHRHLVLHRDLKPGNILVTPEGQPKLLDFGIAKLLAADPLEEQTRSLNVFMTPEFASPEQLRGEPMNTSSDVYSLGVLLRRLLKTERAPQPKRLPSDLEHIIRKALHPEPDLRYAGVQEFSEDLRHHLEGLPVSARRPGVVYSARKFVHRNMAMTVAASLLVLTSVTGAIGIVRQARLARLQKQRAEQRFADVRTLAGSFLLEVHDALHNTPGTLAARQLIMKRGIAYLNQLQKDAVGDRGLQAELAVAYDRFGSLTFHVSDALELHRKALRINQDLVRAEPANRKYQEQLAESYSSVANLLRETGKTKGSLENSSKAVAVLESLQRADPSNRDYKIAIMGGYQQLARSLLESGAGPSQAVALHRKTLELARVIRQQSPNDDAARRGLMNAYLALARGLMDAGDTTKALGAALEGLQIAKSVPGRDQNAMFQRDLWVAELRTGQVLNASGDPAGAFSLFRGALAIIEALYTADPGDMGHGYGVSLTHLHLAKALQALKRVDEALLHDAKALMVAGALYEKDPDKIETRIHLGSVYSHMGQLYIQEHRYPRAAEAARKALGFLTELAVADPINIPVQLAFATARQTEHIAIAATARH